MDTWGAPSKRPERWSTGEDPTGGLRQKWKQGHKYNTEWYTKVQAGVPIWKRLEGTFMGAARSQADKETGSLGGKQVGKPKDRWLG